MNSAYSFPLRWPATWPITVNRSHSRFASRSIAHACSILELELRRLGAEDVVISSDLKLNRSTATPKSDQAIPANTGVAVYFTLEGKPRVLACDRWNCCEDNLWAIAQHIDALRAQERWGVGTKDQAFAGYEALPPARKTLDWQLELGLGELMLPKREDIETAFRTLARTAHPDVGGDPERFKRLCAAREEGLAQTS